MKAFFCPNLHAIREELHRSLICQSEVTPLKTQGIAPLRTRDNQTLAHPGSTTACAAQQSFNTGQHEAFQTELQGANAKCH